VEKSYWEFRDGDGSVILRYIFGEIVNMRGGWAWLAILSNSGFDLRDGEPSDSISNIN
jgi:hypothetical protein